jgi:hypothetical protein
MCAESAGQWRIKIFLSVEIAVESVNSFRTPNVRKRSARVTAGRAATGQTPEAINEQPRIGTQTHPPGNDLRLDRQTPLAQPVVHDHRDGVAVVVGHQRVGIARDAARG